MYFYELFHRYCSDVAVSVHYCKTPQLQQLPGVSSIGTGANAVPVTSTTSTANVASTAIAAAQWSTVSWTKFCCDFAMVLHIFREVNGDFQFPCNYFKGKEK